VYLKDEEDVYGEEARGEDDVDDDDEGQEAEMEATLRANVLVICYNNFSLSVSLLAIKLSQFHAFVSSVPVLTSIHVLRLSRTVFVHFMACTVAVT